MPVLIRCDVSMGAGVATLSVRRRAERMLRALELEDAELSVVLCGAANMRKLNRLHRGLDRSTDVLSFGMEEGAGPRLRNGVLGDIVISIPDAKRQAKSSGREPLAEVTMLLAHGLLHLLGLDHRTRSEERRMRARTDALIAAATTTPQKPVVDRTTRGPQSRHPLRTSSKQR